MNKLLFVSNSFGMGGAEKLLLDIIKILKNNFNITILIFKDDGPLSQEMHNNCNVKKLFMPGIDYFLFRKIKFYRKHKINNFVKNNEFDIIIGFMEGKSTDLVSEIDANVKKIGWIHNDFRELDTYSDVKTIYETYSKLDELVFVSNAAKDAFFQTAPNIKAKSHVIYNFIDEKRINRKSLTERVENETFTFLNVSMLRKQKSQDRLIRIASKLKNLGYEFKIQIIGEGPLRHYLEKLILKYNVSDKVFLLGLKDNPYPYMKACDCFVLSSDYEGYGIVLKEALLLRKLILSTDVVGPREILLDGKYGLIVKNNEESLFYKMQEILNNQYLFKYYYTYLDNYVSDDNNNIEKMLIKLFNENRLNL